MSHVPTFELPEAKTPPFHPDPIDLTQLLEVDLQPLWGGFCWEPLVGQSHTNGPRRHHDFELIIYLYTSAVKLFNTTFCLAPTDIKRVLI